jgi:peptidoglycan/LPS O-acetylase OafA/YrhL
MNETIEMQGRGRIPALDGLRAIAIIVVLLFHLNAQAFSIGWTGVLLFFVLSGYLITNILLEAKNSSRYFSNFYARRSLRIFPAYYLYLLIVALAVYFLTPLNEWVKRPEPSEWVYFILYVQNYWLGVTSFGTPLSWPLGHTWTLAIEEQYYLIWPAIVYCLNRKALVIFCTVLIAASPAVRIWIFAATQNPLLTLLTLPSQCDAIAMGALAALFGHSPNGSSYKRRIECALVILVLLWSALIMSSGWESYTSPRLWLSNTQNIPFMTLANLVFAAVLLLSLDETSLFSKILSQSVLTHIGRISYGLYLYHVLIFILVDLIIEKLRISTSFPLTTIAIKLTLLFGVAILSYRYFDPSSTVRFAK